MGSTGKNFAHPPRGLGGAPTERNILMLKFFQTPQIKDVKLPIVAFCGSVALLALVSATPASAQGVPAGLLRLDPVAASDNGKQRAEVDRAQVDRAHAKNRRAFARDRRNQH
jgi:hypothetical protein